MTHSAKDPKDPRNWQLPAWVLDEDKLRRWFMARAEGLSIPASCKKAGIGSSSWHRVQGVAACQKNTGDGIYAQSIITKTDGLIPEGPQRKLPVAEGKRLAEKVRKMHIPIPLPPDK